MVHDNKVIQKNNFLSYNNDQANKSVDSDIQDTSSFQLGNNGLGGQNDESQFMGGGANNQSQIDNFIKKHQDATLNRNHWIPDQKARQCFKCTKDFTFFYRKHHCRICGNVFCHNCTTVKAIISNGKTFNLKLLGVEQKNQDMKDLEKIKLISKEIEKIDKNMGQDYTLLINELEEEKNDGKTYSLMGLNTDQYRQEKQNYMRLKEFSAYHIQNIVSEIMKNNSIDLEKWGNKLLEFVRTAVDSVKPSSRLLNDSLDFNQFIKIKIINYKDNSKSAYINGIVMRKNLADKRMLDKIENPQILLLKDSLGQVKSDPGLLLTDLSTVIDQEDYQVNIVKQKLTQVLPNIIIVEQDVSYKILDALREAKITVITNLADKKMKRMARYTQTIISPSYNVVDKSFVLGKCKSFRVEKPYTANLVKNKNHDILGEINGSNHVSLNQNKISNERNLIFFEGCNPALGCTILLSGNVQTELIELKQVKQALREMLKLARNIVLERAFLMQLGCSIPKSMTDDGQINVNESPFLITRNIQNRQTLVLSKVIMKKGLVTDKIINQTPQTCQQQMMMVNTSNQFSSQQLQNIAVGNYNDEISMALNQMPVDQPSQMMSPQGLMLQTPQMNPTLQSLNQKVNENYVKTKIDSMCGCPKKEKMTFYQKNQDETIGNMLKKLCKSSSDPCEVCKEPMFKHFLQYYHRDGCIEIQLQLQQNNDTKNKTQTIKPKEPTEKKREIIMKGFCKECNKQVTADVQMSNQFYEYSKARFFEQFFYNGDKLVNLMPDSAICCNHRSLRDIQRIFIIPGGFQITFTFIPLDVYTIEMIQPKTQDTSETFNAEIDLRKRIIEQGVHSANEELKTRIQTILEFIKTQKRSIVTQEQERNMIQQNTNIPIFIQPLKIIKARLRDLEKEISRVVQMITLPIHDVDNMFGVIFLERKVLVNFLTFSKLLDEISSISCLLLVMLSQRVMIIKQSQAQMQDSQFESSAFIQANLELINNDPSTYQSMFKNQSENTNVDRNTQIQNMNAASMERATLINLKKFQSINNVRSEYDLLFQELFQNVDMNQTIPQNQTQLGGAQSKQIGTQNMQPQYNFEAAKQIIISKVKDLKFDLALLYQNNRKYIKPPESSIKTREGSLHNQNKQANHLSSNFQMIQGNIENYIYNQAWVQSLQNGFVAMPLGTDNLYVPLKENDIGSLISFVLASNIYKEAMIKQNYMDISQKIKGLGKHPRQPGQIGVISNAANTEANPTPNNIRESTINFGFAQQAQYQSQNTIAANNNLDETIKLIGKNDVFNTELSAHQIETELLCGERLFFVVKFSSDKNDLSVKIVKNGSVAKLKQTSLTFTTGQIKNKKKTKKSQVDYHDFQENICPQLSKDYLDSAFYKEAVNELDKVIGLLNAYYFGQGQLSALGQQNSNLMAANNLISPGRTIVTGTSNVLSGDDSVNIDMNNDQHFNHILEQNVPSMRESINANFLNNLKSPPMGNTNIPNQNTPQMNSNNNIPYNIGDPSEFCGIKSPVHTLQTNPNEQLRSELNVPKVDFELKIYFPKKFEALRRFYCGSQYNFIQSLLKTKEWTTVSGGKTRSKFYRSLDDKYVYKEIRKGEFKMFLEFAPQYFDYLCKSFFHNYPCALCKILGAFKIKIITNKNGSQKIVTKYLYITENLNFGIKPEDESHIIRYDLKGSSLNRFVKNKDNKDIGRVVLHDNNFLLEFMGRPLPIRYTINRILHICINNDTLCLSKSNIVDYSLLTIIDTKRKKIRFGIIDYVQQYTLDKIFESKFKNIINGGEAPTIVDPEKYKQRFKRAMKKYFVGMCIQEEKIYSQQVKQEPIDNDEQFSDDDDEVNDTNNKIEKEEQVIQQVSIIATSKHDTIDNETDINNNFNLS